MGAHNRDDKRSKNMLQLCNIAQRKIISVTIFVIWVSQMIIGEFWNSTNIL